MTRFAALSAMGSALALAGLQVSAVAQTPPEAEAAHPDAASASKAWYAMISIEQSLGPAGCEAWRYKINTSRPIPVEGPHTFTPLHADELVTAWMVHLSEHAPQAYKWLHGAYGHDAPQVYIRETSKEAIEAFAADRHHRPDPACERSVIVATSSASFTFNPPEGFARADFERAPMRTDAVVVRELSKIPGG